MADGITIINHAIRLKLMLSLQEYTVMDFFHQCEIKGLNPRENSANMIAVNFEDLLSVTDGLHMKEFMFDGLVTEKWTNEFPKGKKKVSKPAAGFKPPTLEEVVNYFREKGYMVEQAKKAWEYYEAGGWRDGAGKAVLSWKQKMIAVWMKDEFKVRSEIKPEGTGISMETTVFNR